MKIAVTGGTSGLGKSLIQTWSRHGYHCANFSRSNGYDINDHTVVVEAIENFDVLINNACDGFAQTGLLYAIFKQWQGQKKYIINIGSDVTNQWYEDTPLGIAKLPWTRHRSLDYRTCKQSLEDAQLFLGHQNRWPRMMMIKPGPIQGPNASLKSMLDPEFNARSKLDSDKLADFIFELWNNRSTMFISTMSVCPLDFYCATDSKVDQ